MFADVFESETSTFTPLKELVTDWNLQLSESSDVFPDSAASVAAEPRGGELKVDPQQRRNLLWPQRTSEASSER